MERHRTFRLPSGSQKGFTLPELLVSLVIFGILVTQTLWVFTAANSAYRFEETVGDTQERVRACQQFIVRPLRNLSYISNFDPTANRSRIDFTVMEQMGSADNTSGANYLDDASMNWTADEWAGTTVAVIGGKGAGAERTVLSNTANRLYITPGWDSGMVPDATSNYAILASYMFRIDDRSSLVFVRNTSGEQAFAKNITGLTLTGFKADGNPYDPNEPPPDPNDPESKLNRIVSIQVALSGTSDRQRRGAKDFTFPTKTRVKCRNRW